MVSSVSLVFGYEIYNLVSHNIMIGDKIRKIDIFKKVPRDISEGTNVGGCVSILTAVVIVALVAV